MSIKLMHEAFKLNMDHTPKFVFVALSDNASDEGLCYPSIKTICAKTSLSERTVQYAIIYLEEGGYLKQEMRNGRSTHYFITSPNAWLTPEKYEPNPRKWRTPANLAPLTPANLAPLTPANLAPLTPANLAPTPANLAPHPRKPCTHPRKPCTQNSNLTIIEPSLNHKPPDWLSVEVWESFVLFRKEKKEPLSDHAMTLALKKLDELRKAGHDPVRVIEQSILNGWKGLFSIRETKQSVNKYADVWDDPNIL